MGIFNRRKQREQAEQEAAARAAEFEALRTHVEQLEGRLASSEYAKSVADTRIEEFSTRLGAIDSGLGTMGAQIIELATSTQDAGKRVAALEAKGIDLDEVNARLRELSDQLTAAAAATPPPLPLSATPAPPPPPELDEVSPGEPQAPAVTEEEVDELRQRIDALQEQLGSVDIRVTSIATELTNQLNELSSDIDELANRPDPATGDDEQSTADDTAEIEARLVERLEQAMEGVADSTERLAAEQARYEIQFRADLAELAERLRRPGSA